MFSDILEIVLQCEIEEQLGYEKHQRRNDGPKNYRNGSTKRKLITQFGKVEWQNRPLEAYFPFVFMNAIHYKIRDNHQIISKTAYVVLGINHEGYKEILGI